LLSLMSMGKMLKMHFQKLEGIVIKQFGARN